MDVRRSGAVQSPVVPIAALVVVAGLFVLTKTADQFVIGAARLAYTLNISPIVIGAIIIGFGTSAPEMVVSAISAGQGEIDVAVGNIIGSNVANLTLVLGVAALVLPLGIKGATLKREAPLSTGAVLVFAYLIQDGLTTREAVFSALLLAAILAFLLYEAARSGGDEDDLAAEVDEYLDEGVEHPLKVEATRTVIGLLGVVAGAYATVWGALEIADELGLAKGFVGLTLVALGTSLPELVTSVAAARKGEDDLIIGNLLGSNLFNSLGVAAAAGFAGPGPITDTNLTGLATVLMVGVAVGAFVFMITGHKVVRWEGLLLIVVYVVTVPLLAG